MADTALAVMQNIVQTLAATGRFAQASLGGPATPAVPRAVVTMDKEELLPADDAAARWHRLSLSVTLHVRSAHRAEAVARAMELKSLACEALLAEPFRGGLCRHVPTGDATEIRGANLCDGMDRPELELVLYVRCHFESTEDV